MGEVRKPLAESIEYSTPWFQLVSKRVEGEPEPYYALRMIDYVCIVALTPPGDLVLVRQYRPAVNAYTLELPAGHVEPNQTPEQAARLELAEETGFTAARFDLLGEHYSDTGRHENTAWCYLATDVTVLPGWTAREAGIEVVLAPSADLRRLMLAGEISHAPHLAAVMLAALRDGRFREALFPTDDAIRSPRSAGER